MNRSWIKFESAFGEKHLGAFLITTVFSINIFYFMCSFVIINSKKRKWT